MNIKIKEILNFLIFKTSSLGFLNLLNFFVTIFTISLILKSFGPLLWGKFILVQLWPNYLGILCLWSFTNNEVREVSIKRYSLIDINRIFSESFFIQIFLTIVSSLILIIAKFLNLINVNLYGLLGIIIIVIGHGTQFHWLLNGLEKIWQVAFFQLLSKVVILLLIYATSIKNIDHNVLLILFGFGAVISNFFCLCYILIKLDFEFKPRQISALMILNRFKNGFLYFFSSLTANLKNISAPLLLNHFYGEYYVGLFASLERIKSILVQISQPLTNSVFPRIAYLNVNLNKSANDFKIVFFLILIAICLPFLSIVLLFPELILLKFAGIEFTHLKLELQIISIVSLLTIISEYFYYLNLISNNLRKKILIFNSVGLLIIFCTGFILIKSFNVIGAIISLLILEIFNLLLIFYKKKI